MGQPIDPVLLPTKLGKNEMAMRKIGSFNVPVEIRVKGCAATLDGNATSKLDRARMDWGNHISAYGAEEFGVEFRLTSHWLAREGAISFDVAVRDDAGSFDFEEEKFFAWHRRKAEQHALGITGIPKAVVPEELIRPEPTHESKPDRCIDFLGADAGVEEEASGADQTMLEAVTDANKAEGSDPGQGGGLDSSLGPAEVPAKSKDHGAPEGVRHGVGLYPAGNFERPPRPHPVAGHATDGHEATVASAVPVILVKSAKTTFVVRAEEVEFEAGDRISLDDHQVGEPIHEGIPVIRELTVIRQMKLA